MSTNKNLITGLCSGTRFQLIIIDSKQIADWKGPVDGSKLGEQRVSSKDIEKFMVCLCKVSVGSVGNAWQAVLQQSMRTLKNKS